MRSARGTVAQPSVSVAQQVMVVSNVLEAKTGDVRWNDSTGAQGATGQPSLKEA
jgi:hypothetical protein